MSQPFEEPRRHFITGGCGFIGSHLVDRLRSAGQQVTVYDNVSSGKRRWIEGHVDEDGFLFVEADLLDREALACAMAGHDVVWHLGANTDIPGGSARTDLDLQNCTIATHNVLEAMRATEIDTLVFASSAAVYGDVPLQPLKETYAPLIPISLYGAAKLACEALISAYNHLFGINANVFRFANVVGGRMGHGVTYDFLGKLKRDPQNLEILGDGRQEKSYFLVEDCIEGMLCALRNGHRGFEVYNLGSETSTNVERIADIVAAEMGLNGVRRTYTGGPRGWPGDAPFVLLDTAKARSLGWRARHDSDAAIRIATRRLLEQT